MQSVSCVGEIVRKVFVVMLKENKKVVFTVIVVYINCILYNTGTKVTKSKVFLFF
jgi:hypothetical protein